ncbi:LemA family protein [Sphingosinicella sp. LHD-64]|uniref:LemA family protein n=1 Tax=Sphingosinicella sp. LHD-64 TaxID=3072139 RepID=UPI00280E6C80|nr:LemA family protein [Sphingosinicella sp. LHD-64]MDQ8758293.1 LemA family protein [Sphingosinicella sp. LHD-64]
MRLRLLAAFAPVLLFLTACGVNSIPTAEETARARWADVQSQYQRRADLIPNLVNTVRAAAQQERTVLREVTEARASATRITVTPEQLSDPAAMARFAEAQGRLTISLQRLQEAYPELQTNANFRDLQSQIEGTENRIQVARRDYNSAVQAYNTEIRTFPSVIGARIIYGSQPMTPFEAEAGAQGAPTVDFGNMQ